MILFGAYNFHTVDNHPLMIPEPFSDDFEYIKKIISEIGQAVHT